MPNTKIRDEWEPLVKQIIADLGPRAGPTPILQELQARVRRLRASGAKVPARLPSTRTVQRIKEDLAPEELQEYERFHWPQSMESGALPWAAGRAALELLEIQMDMHLCFRHELRKYVKEQGDARNLTQGLSASPPTVRTVRWYWRLSQVAPDLPKVMPNDDDSIMVKHDYPDRHRLAYALAAHEAAGKTPKDFLSRVETYLTLAPWQDGDKANRYEYAVAFGIVPELRDDGLEDGLSPAYLNEARAGVIGAR
jgi:hypothetical protein